MSKRIFKLIDNFIQDEEPEIDELNNFLIEIVVDDAIEPSDKTILTRYSKIKNYLRDKFGSELSEDEIKQIKPPGDIVDRVLASDLKIKQSKTNIKFDQQLVDKILNFKDSKNMFEKFIFLQFVSGRRLNEIAEFEHKIKIPKGSTYKIKMKLSKKKYKKESDMDEVKLIPGEIDNITFKKKLKGLRDLVEDISVGDLNKRINRYLKKNIRKDLTSHTLRGFYAHYLFNFHNPENLNINGFLTKVLNHDTGTSSLNYSNYTFEK
tara:strand:- start:13426 stop:14217 length:792 start_codon:yes stop_codon:yes gene_type:complete